MARRGRRPESSAPPSVEILNVAFHRASLATPHGDTKPERDRLRARLKIVRSSATVVRHLRLEARPLTHPELTEFQEALLAGAFGPGTVGRTQLRLRRAEERIRGLARLAEREVQKANGSEEYGAIVRSFYGRVSSFVREVDPDLIRIRKMARHLRERPRLDPAAPTLVVAGFPNVGKSSLVERLSTAHPKVAPYPFTTLAVAVGHADLGFDRLQVVDTPGVLDRSGQQNPAEAEAETAVSKAATVVLFVLDPSDASGYSIDEQEALLARWREEYPDLPFVVVETKRDLVERTNDRIHVSAKTGEGVDELWRALRPHLRPEGEMPPMEEAVEESPDASEEDEVPAPPPPPRRRPRGR